MILITYLLGSPSPRASLFVFVSPQLAINVVDLWLLKGNCLQRWVFDFWSFPIMTYFPSRCLAQHLHAHNWVHVIIYWEKWGGGANRGKGWCTRRRWRCLDGDLVHRGTILQCLFGNLGAFSVTFTHWHQLINWKDTLISEFWLRGTYLGGCTDCIIS